MKTLLLILSVSLFSISCNSKKSGNNKISDDPNYAALYSGFYQNPTTLAEKEQNAIIEYATENELPLTRTESGLYYMITAKGQGPRLRPGEKVKVDYTGYFLDGKEFDSSYKRGEPLNFAVGQMIRGWNEGLLYMQSGGKATFVIPSRLAYGAGGFPGAVPPNTVIAFDIHVLF